MAVYVGEAKEKKFAEDCCKRDLQGIHCILYQTEPRVLCRVMWFLDGRRSLDERGDADHRILTP